jgi:leukotriene-A4 hydrolase
MALSPGDPNSYSRPDLVTTKHLHLDLTVDFTAKVLAGDAVLTLERTDPAAGSVLLDASKLEVTGVRDEATGQALEWTLGSPSINGERLEVTLPAGPGQVQVRITYRTTPASTALAWLSPGQTAGKKRPFLFSQCEAIHCRSMVPCQDSPSVKATYSAAITAPRDLTVLMSGIREGEPEPAGEQAVTRFKQAVPVQSYLIAIAVGALESRTIGPRSKVWSEAELVEQAAFDFSETETMLQKAEELCGPYVWGIYDILVLPPSFPFGGMENPCLTFATPTLLSGDKSNADVIAHEIAHSWTGNLVTNVNFEHFWLNEGFTVFTERKIVGLMRGEAARHFSAILRWKDLQETVEEVMGPTNQFTALCPKLAGCDPDDAFSVVPYEKGSTFLWYLEDLVGGPAVFEPFLRSYYTHFAYKSINSEQFKAFFLEHFGSQEAVTAIDWDTWLHSPGMPIYKPKFDDSLAVACWDLAAAWQAWDPATPAAFKHDFAAFSAGQKSEFLWTLLKGAVMPHAKLEAMAAMYALDSCSNVETEFKWIRLGLAARWEAAVAPALRLATVQGRMKFVRPLYRDLYGWEEKRQQAIDTFLAHRDQYMGMCADMVAKDLHLPAA